MLHIPWLGAVKVKTNRSENTLVFGRREEDGRKAGDCAEYFNGRKRGSAGVYNLRMVARRKTRTWGLKKSCHH
jgi:hypothetical protein